MTAAFYCVADERYFLGAVGLVNSLRLVGHDEQVHLLDCGLTAEQRELLAPEVRLVDGPRGTQPHVLKAIAPRAEPAEVMALIDADMIATRPLTELFEQAAAGRAVGGDAELDRFCPEWGELLGLGPVERRPYLSTGLVVLGGDLGREVVELVDERRDAVEWDRTFWRRNDADYPLVHADQDLINAVLAARAAPDQVVAFDPKLSPAPPFAGVRIADRATLRCVNAAGDEPYVIHHWLAKPWLERTHDGVYSQLLRRLLGADDVAVRVPAEMVPLWLRTGPLAGAERLRINARERMRARGRP